MKQVLNKWWWVGFLLLMVLPQFVFGQQAPLRIIDSGVSARAMGMGGAFVGLADDASALFSNPAGIAHLNGVNVQFDYLLVSGSEDFQISRRATGIIPELYSLSGNTPQLAAITYGKAFEKISIGLGFGWHREQPFGSHFEMREPSEWTSIRSLSNVNIRSIFDHEFSGGEDRFVFGVGSQLSKEHSLGFSFTVLTGKPQSHLSFETQREVFPFEGDPSRGAQIDTTLKTEELSGNSIVLSYLTRPNEKFSFGLNFAFPYTRESDTQYESTGRRINHDTQEEQFSQSSSRFIFHTEIPWQFSMGGAVNLKQSLLLSTSFTYAPWKNVCTALRPNSSCAEPFPSEHDFALQSNLMQLRVGGEYRIKALMMRAGFFLDDQPLSRSSVHDADRGSAPPEDDIFEGFTIGAGYRVGSAAFDFAYVRENGSAVFKYSTGGISDREFVVSDAKFHQNRFLFSFGFSYK